MALIDPVFLRSKRERLRGFSESDLRIVLDAWEITGDAGEAADMFDPPLSPEEAERALALAEQKWPEKFADFQKTLANVGISSARIAKAHRRILDSDDPKTLGAVAKTAETLHKLAGRLEETTATDRGLEAAVKLVEMITGKRPIPAPLTLPEPAVDAEFTEEEAG